MSKENFDIYPDGFEILNEPLTTSEGFINEACLRELEAAIRNAPKTFDRLAGDREWSTPAWTADTDVLGNFAGCAVKLFGGLAPPDLAAINGFLREVLHRGLFANVALETANFRLANVSLCEINRALWDALGDLPQFLAWNDKEKVGENWIDLDALLHNVCVQIRNERRHFAAFNSAFEKEYGREEGAS